jgi:hypothetical protein
VGLAIEIVKPATVPRSAVDTEAGTIMVERDGVGRIGLQLNRIRPGCLGGIDEPDGAVDVAVVIARHLGDHIGRLRAADVATLDHDQRAHDTTLRKRSSLSGR